MTEPYLIAHIVRGEPAFDIAIKLQIGDEEGWIIPTSGHRAYPFAQWSLCEIELSGYPTTYVIDLIPNKIPSPWPDHYSANDRARNRAIAEDMDLAKDAARPGEGQITNLAERLGFLPKAPTITRRR